MSAAVVRRTDPRSEAETSEPTRLRGNSVMASDPDRDSRVRRGKKIRIVAPFGT